MRDVVTEISKSFRRGAELPARTEPKRYVPSRFTWTRRTPPKPGRRPSKAPVTLPSIKFLED